MKIIKHKDILLIPVLLILSICTLKSADKTAGLVFDGVPYSITMQTLNDSDYISLGLLTQTVFKDWELVDNNWEIKKEDKRLKTAVASFFVLYQEAVMPQVIQMNLPTLMLKGNLFVPINSFFKALERVGLFNVNIDRNIITLNSIVEKSPVVRNQSEFLSDSLSKEQYQGKKKKKDTTLDFDKKNSINKKAGKSQVNIKQPTIKSDTINEPVKKKKQADFPAQPDVYRIPPDLFRNLNIPENTEDTIKNNDYTYGKAREIFLYSDRTRNLYASKSLIIEKELPEITKISASFEDNVLEFRFFSEDTIRAYQKPEINQKEVLLRIPGMVNSIRDFSELYDLGPLNKIIADKIRDYLVIKFKFKSVPVKCAAKRVNYREIILDIFFDETPVTGKKSDKISKSNESDKYDQEPAEKTKSNGSEKWNLDVIVLDPGHGGKDFGAISINGHPEKELALSIALQLKEMIEEEMPTTKVVMTRDDDTFIELYRRGQIANQAKGKLFISIHLNSMPKKPWPSNGFESYILRPGRNDDAVRVANDENSVIKFESDKSKYKKLTEEELIIATIAQSGFVKLSERFAVLLQDEVSKTTQLADRGVNQAGFYVLVGASMPNVLFEAGFLSNEKDEAFLLTKEGRKKIARGMLKAIKRYAGEYKTLLGGNR